MNLATQHVSHPAEAEAVDRRNPHPESIHSLDRAKVEAFVRRESKRANRVVSTAVEYFRLPSGKVFPRFVALSSPVLKVQEASIKRHDRPYFNDDDLKHERKKREGLPKCTGACCN